MTLLVQTSVTLCIRSECDIDQKPEFKVDITCQYFEDFSVTLDMDCDSEHVAFLTCL